VAIVTFKLRDSQACALGLIAIVITVVDSIATSCPVNASPVVATECFRWAKRAVKFVAVVFAVSVTIALIKDTYTRTVCTLKMFSAVTRAVGFIARITTVVHRITANMPGNTTPVGTQETKWRAVGTLHFVNTSYTVRNTVATTVWR
jgi:hypothetical protein